ncbi:hypothetical protein QMT40_001781 [Parvibaculaceae bacterium PLY_AMNH_Bact1]|nr:hypothetical protein QMT40_001781 [Parvibaculaceae bacterium PLY_AMNH_Bact1]
MPALPPKNNDVSVPPQPRLTGNQEADAQAVQQWMNLFIQSAVRESKMLDPAFHASTGDFEETGVLPDPAQTSLALAQLIANLALQEVRGRFPEDAGQFTVSGTNDFAQLQFSEERASSTYFVLCQIVDQTGSPASGARQIKTIEKSTTGFTVTLVAAPGASAAVTYDFLIIQNL